RRTPLVDFLNEEVQTYYRWCTPSVLLDAPRVGDVYATDVSASLSVRGTLADNSGIFEEAHRLAAEAYGADHTLFSVHGSTGSVYVVLRYLSLMYGTPLILASRNIHISVQNACEDFGVRYRFLKSYYDPEFDMFIPPKPEDVVEALERYPEANAVLLSNPTYEGLSCRLRETVEAIRGFNEDVLIIVDEAWGAHFRFSDRLPETAMEVGADISIQSTHKQGGSLQQTGMIHWKDGLVDAEVMWEAYRGYVTTSPSYHMLASLDAARAYLVERGRKEIERVIRLSERFREELRERVPRLGVLDREHLERWSEHVNGVDLTKTLVSLTEYDITGFRLDEELQRRFRVVPETANYNSLLFITTFQLPERAVDATVEALSRLLRGREIPRGEKRLLTPPLRDQPPKIEPYLLRRMPKKLITQRIPIDLAVGMISAETIVPYPPGVPILIKGYRITREVVEYLKAVRDAGGLLIARDTSLREVEGLKFP
ncbi:MAG: decarboxylase, partial [Candidatus Korarchaeota archaeon]|nr:decarboxylase [Candidatus Korarchaeota archaeon]